MEYSIDQKVKYVGESIGKYILNGEILTVRDHNGKVMTMTSSTTPTEYVCENSEGRKYILLVNDIIGI